MPYVVYYYGDGGFDKEYVVQCPSWDELEKEVEERGVEYAECVDDDFFGPWG